MGGRTGADYMQSGNDNNNNCNPSAELVDPLLEAPRDPMGLSEFNPPVAHHDTDLVHLLLAREQHLDVDLSIVVVAVVG